MVNENLESAMETDNKLSEEERINYLNYKSNFRSTSTT
jgi:hypothetical protein